MGSMAYQPQHPRCHLCFASVWPVTACQCSGLSASSLPGDAASCMESMLVAGFWNACRCLGCAGYSDPLCVAFLTFFSSSFLPFHCIVQCAILPLARGTGPGFARESVMRALSSAYSASLCYLLNCAGFIGPNFSLLVDFMAAWVAGRGWHCHGAGVLTNFEFNIKR